MELSDPGVIASLVGETKKLRKTNARHGSPESLSARPVSRTRRRCRCGQCNFCIDNARWEKIFNDKFADPNYYGPKPVRFGSSLDWLPK